jgi:Uncharacterized conserved protein
MSSRLRVTLLAGGVGGAKMAEGLAALDRVDLTVIGNIADDDEFHGLWVSPDIDTLTYTLSGQIDRNQGWGVANEGHRALGVEIFLPFEPRASDGHRACWIEWS